MLLPVTAWQVQMRGWKPLSMGGPGPGAVKVRAPISGESSSRTNRTVSHPKHPAQPTLFRPSLALLAWEQAAQKTSAHSWPARVPREEEECSRLGASKALERQSLSLKGREVGDPAWEGFLGCQDLAWRHGPSWPWVLSVQGKGAGPSRHWKDDPVPISIPSPGLGGRPGLLHPPYSWGPVSPLDTSGLSWQRKVHTLATKTGRRGGLSHAMAPRGAPHMLPESLAL